MKEMLIVGRGGEGVVLASQILADTFARAGYWVQSFPEFKAERRGAPISAFLRWDETGPIHRRYRVRDCDVLAVVSASAPPAAALGSVRPGGFAVLNREARFPLAAPFEIARVPGSSIARRNGVLSSEGRPMGNMAVLGACVSLLIPDRLTCLDAAIEARMGKIAAANVAAAREGYERCRLQHRLAGDPSFHTLPPAPRRDAQPLFPVSTTDSLANLTGTWSLDRPVLTSDCTACALCALFCPEGVITRTDGSMAIDERYCKGCGICEVVCPVTDAIHMEAVTA